ncbi:MAG: 3-phosphoshikimate 1-carboxyvinyltransferase [Candidatus Taylorbacteria bacterium]|nr:3-phosphoshikimate 1-carboxyvinyltransferase [Candidatus Taylorbacteria bacterium]
MKIIAHTTEEIKGEATPPSSKSQTIRGLIFATLAKGTSAIKNPLHSQDTVDAIRACRALGANIMVKEDRIVIESDGVPLLSDTTLNTGDSGVTTHFLMPVTGLRGPKGGPITFDCGAQMKQRPVESLVTALQRLGLKVKSQHKNGHCPLQISGELFGGKATISGKSSQYLSALLISLPCAKNDSVITVNDLQERPYVEMTEMWLREQGIVYTHTFSTPRNTTTSASGHSSSTEEEKGERKISQDIYTIKGRQAYKPFIKTIPGDFSSASYLIAAGALFDGQVVLHGLDMNDPQGDKALVTILKEMGADIEIQGNKMTITGGRPLKGMKIDANAIPDMVPTLAVIAAVAKGKTEILNVANARLKETDRLHSMTEGLTKMGAKVEETKDSLTISGGKLYGASVHGFNDHRTVMALSLAGMLASGETFVDTAEAITKTFPDYVKVMKSLGAQMNIR